MGVGGGLDDLCKLRFDRLPLSLFRWVWVMREMIKVDQLPLSLSVFVRFMKRTHRRCKLNIEYSNVAFV